MVFLYIHALLLRSLYHQRGSRDTGMQAIDNTNEIMECTGGVGDPKATGDDTGENWW